MDFQDDGFNEVFDMSYEYNHIWWMMQLGLSETIHIIYPARLMNKDAIKGIITDHYG